MQRSPHSASSSRSPTDVHLRTYDRDRDRELDHHRERVYSHRGAARDSRSRSPLPQPPPLRQHQHHGPPSATPLPSIHHLHPDLPPPHAHAHAHRQQHPSHPSTHAQPYSYTSPSEFLPNASYGHPSSSFFAGSPVTATSHGRLSPAPAAYPPPPAYDERRIPFERQQPASASTARPPPPPPPPQQSHQHQHHQQHHQQQSYTSSASYPEPRMSPPEADSDQDQNESERGPPKKKRRRQALSCTECKRRKIKCDRMHPCGPCARRSEPDKCQWHVIEPVDKYVTRSEWEELFGRYRILEERYVRLEKLIVQLHPEITENSPYELASMHHNVFPSPTAPRSAAMRAYALAGPGISGATATSSSVNQRMRPNTPLSAQPGPSPRSVHVTAHPGPSISSSSGVEGPASVRSGSAPPPMLPTTAAAHATLPHPPPHSDRRTSAPGSHTSFATVSERTVPPYHQIPSETAPSRPRTRPLTAPSPHSYTFPPPPPPPEDPPVYLSSRSQGGFMHGRSASLAESPIVSSHGTYDSRNSGQPYASPLSPGPGSSGRSTSRLNSTAPAVAVEVADVRYSGRYEGSASASRRRRSDSKNGMAQTSEASDALRHRWSASPPHSDNEVMRPLSSRRYRTDSGPPSAASAPVLSSLLRPISACARSDENDSAPTSPRIDSFESAMPSRKRTRRGSLFLNIPSSGSKPATPPPTVIVH